MTEKDDGACSAMFMRLVVFFPCKRCNCVTNKPVFPFSTALQTEPQEGLRIFYNFEITSNTVAYFTLGANFLLN